jgi:hypothetical protein
MMMMMMMIMMIIIIISLNLIAGLTITFKLF